MRYPKLERAYGGVHANIHPNCRHVIMPYIEELADNPGKDRELSNKPFNIDKRSQRQIDAYNNAQKKKRQMNADRRQWERYQLALPNDAPRTLSGFRSMKKANSKRYQELKGDYRTIMGRD